LSVATFDTRPDITHIAIDDLSPNQVCLAWDSTRRSSLIHAIAARFVVHIVGPSVSGCVAARGGTAPSGAARSRLARSGVALFGG
jgi:hypothetical protein